MVFVSTAAIGAALALLPTEPFSVRAFTPRINLQPLLRRHSSLLSTISLSDEVDIHKSAEIDRRPHEQRVTAPRNARRLNHAFQHLYRHADPRYDDNDWNASHWSKDDEFQRNAMDIIGNININSTIAEIPMDPKVALSAVHYLHVHGGYSLREIQEMRTAFPPLLEIDVMRHLRPKMRFLKDCLGGGTYAGNDERQVLCAELKSVLPASFYGARFERTIAPRHAFLVHAGLPHGRTLWETNAGGKFLFEEFLVMHRKPKQFAAMCNVWRTKYSSQKLTNNLPITAEQIVAFDKLFQRGMLSAARNDTSYIHPDEKDRQRSEGPSLMTTANVTSAQLIRYLIQHGANPYEEDVRGASLFHWSAGCGNLDALKELVVCCNELDFHRAPTNDTNSEKSRSYGAQAALLWKASRDDATPLHWAAAGAGPKEFGKLFLLDVVH